MKRLLHSTIFSNHIIFRVLRITIGCCAAIVPFIIIYSRINIGELAHAFSVVQWWTIPMLLIMSFMAMTLQGLRWWILIRAFTDRMSFVHSLSLHLKAAFYSLFLPNSTMQDVVRSVFATKHIGAVISWSSAWINKFMGIVVAFIFSLSGIIMLPRGTVPHSVQVTITVFFCLIIVSLFFSFSKVFTHPLKGIVKKIIPYVVFDFAARLHNGIYEFRNKRRHLLYTFLASITGQLLIVFAHVFVIRGITGTFFIRECLAFIPLIEIISISQPFTPNGIGVREALVALMFSHLGLLSEELGVYIIIINMSLVLRLTGAIPALYDSIKKNRLNTITGLKDGQD